MKNIFVVISIYGGVYDSSFAFDTLEAAKQKALSLKSDDEDHDILTVELEVNGLTEILH
jgi:hypothetical protein